MNFQRLKNQAIAKFTTRYPSFAQKFIKSYNVLSFTDIPWTPVAKPLNKSRIALVTTAGLHHRDQTPFNMNDPKGDPTFRIIDAKRPKSDLMITHDYYDHTDADRDINVVFPLDRLRELQSEGNIGELADTHYGFMGHIDGPHIRSLLDEYSPEVARKLIEDNVDIVLLTPG